MTRRELYDRVTPCGELAYLDMVYLLANVKYVNPAIGLLLINRLAQTERLSREDWIMFAQAVVFLPMSPISGNTVQGWLSDKCELTRQELKMFLEYVQFTDGSQPTFILSETGDIIVTEYKN